ncbi:hypothetical protein J4G37_00065 [Microvirga sp. 3-52]|nr:hypothetical protein [Microvirga sp. 3-52]
MRHEKPHSLVLVMAVPGLDLRISPGHPDKDKRGTSRNEITGRRPVMTKLKLGTVATNRQCCKNA